MMLNAVISTPTDSIAASLDTAVIAAAKLDLYQLAIKHGFIGTFDEFLLSLKIDLSKTDELISEDKPNDLKLGSDNKLFVNTKTTLTQSDW